MAVAKGCTMTEQAPASLTGYQPSDSQRAAATAFQAVNYNCTIEGGMSGAGLVRQTWYDWMDSPEFAAWWEAQAHKHFMRLLPRVYGAMHTAAVGEGDKNLRGGASDRKTILERWDKGFVPRSRQEVDQQGTITLDLTTMTEETLETLAHAVRDVDAQRVLDRARELEAPESA